MSKIKKIINLTDGDAFAINYNKDDLVISCCDCGLVHRLAITKPNNIPDTIIIQVWRDNKLTKKVRKANK